MWTVSLYWCVCVCVIFTNAEVKELGLNEGQVCKEEGGAKWICQKADSCPGAKEEDWKEGTRVSVCSTKDDMPVICCASGDKVNSVGAKSKLKCDQYAQYVFAKRSQGFGDEEETYDTCAATEPLITQGTAAEPKEFPHMALIGYRYKDSITWSCGGTLISEKFVLSAAHCTNIKDLGLAIKVRLGEYNLYSDDDEIDAHSMATDYDIADRINHPQYAPPRKYNDIALYRLAKKVVLNEFIRPACLHSEYAVGKPYGIATGWGLTSQSGPRSPILLKVNLTLTPAMDCVNHYKNRRKEGMPGGIKEESMICAGDLLSGKDTCNGDSGGPLQLRLQKPYCMYSVIGVVSFGPTNCGGGSRPGVYTRVSNYVQWIEEVVWS